MIFAAVAGLLSALACAAVVASSGPLSAAVLGAAVLECILIAWALHHEEERI
jgi:hypothetical protein